MRIMPSHRARTPVKPREISKAVFDMANKAAMISVKIADSPRKNSLNKAQIKALMKKNIQIILSI